MSMGTGYGFGVSGPGGYLSGRNSYTQLLQSMPDPNNGTNLGGLGSVLQKALLGLSMGRDQEEQKQAQQIMRDALSVMQGSPADSIKWDTPRPDGTGDMQTNIPAKAPDSRLAMDLLSSNPRTAPLAFNMGMNQMQMDAAARQAEVAHQHAKDLKASPGWEKPQLPAGYRQNPDGTLSFIPGGPADPQIIAQQKELGRDDFIPVPGIGLYNRRSNDFLGGGGVAAPSSGSPLPAAPASPVATLPLAQQGPAARAELEDATKFLVKQRESLRETEQIESAAKRFEELLSVQDTGGVLRQLPFAQTVEGAMDPQIKEMVSLVDRITPLMRQGLPGAASDRDTAMFRGATFGTDKDPQTNKNIIAGFKTSAQIARDRIDFLDAYVSKNGTLRGADGAWQDYLNANPIFDPNGKVESPSLNKGRKSWREYFKSRGAAKPPQEMSDDELLKALGGR